MTAVSHTHAHTHTYAHAHTHIYTHTHTHTHTTLTHTHININIHCTQIAEGMRGERAAEIFNWLYRPTAPNTLPLAALPRLLRGFVGVDETGVDSCVAWFDALNSMN